MTYPNNLKKAHSKYLKAQTKDEDGISHDHEGRVSIKNSHQQGAATRAYKRFSNICKGLGFTLKKIISCDQQLSKTP